MYFLLGRGQPVKKLYIVILGHLNGTKAMPMQERGGNACIDFVYVSGRMCLLHVYFLQLLHVVLISPESL